MPDSRLLDAQTARGLPWVVAIAFFMQSLDGTILNTALPAMANDLNEDPLRMQGVIIAYMLTVALLIPASGWIADRFGTKKIFFGAILLFSFGSLLCALSHSLDMLIGARVIQGLGGALMLPVGRLVVLRAYGLYHHPRFTRSFNWSSDGRLDGAISHLALDLFD